MYRFKFQGGVEKVPVRGATNTYKFLLFVVCDGQEKTLNQAKSEGYVERTDDEYLVRVPVIKVFSSRQGFGERKSFLSFYIDLRDKIKSIEIRGFAPDSSKVFTGNGRFLNQVEVGNLLGHDSESFHFFKYQSRLSVSEMRKYVTVATASAIDCGGMRRLRI